MRHALGFRVVGTIAQAQDGQNDRDDGQEDAQYGDQREEAEVVAGQSLGIPVRDEGCNGLAALFVVFVVAMPAPTRAALVLVLLVSFIVFILDAPERPPAG